MLHFTGQGTDGVRRFADPLLPQMRRFTGLTGRIGGRHRVARHLFHRRGHFIDRRGRLLDLVVLLLQALSAVEGDGVQFIRRRCQLRGRTADGLQGFAQVLLHGRQGLEQATDFIIAMRCNRLGQVTLGDAFSGAQCFAQWTHDAAGQQHGQRHGRQRRKGNEQADNGTRRFVVCCGLLAFHDDLLGKQLCQIIELLAGAIDHGLHVNQQQFGQLVTAPLLGQGERLGDASAIGRERGFELVIQGPPFRGVDQMVIGRDLLAQLLVARVHLAAVDRNVLGVLVQRHAQGNGADTQHQLANFVTAADARQPLFFDRHRAFADARHLPQGKDTE
ncbi:hypothetical protein D3C73_1031600 [compost metagenome]